MVAVVRPGLCDVGSSIVARHASGGEVGPAKPATYWGGIEVPLQATEASRDAAQEILRRGAETGIFFTGPRDGKPLEGFELNSL